MEYSCLLKSDLCAKESAPFSSSHWYIELVYLWEIKLLIHKYQRSYLYSRGTHQSDALKGQLMCICSVFHCLHKYTLWSWISHTHVRGQETLDLEGNLTNLGRAKPKSASLPRTFRLRPLNAFAGKQVEDFCICLAHLPNQPQEEGRKAMRKKMLWRVISAKERGS